MEVINVGFGRKPNKTYKKYNIYEKSDKGLHGFPSFYHPKGAIHAIVKTLREGHWIETEDNFIVPVIKNTNSYFRIAAPKDGWYKKWNISQGDYKVYLHPTIEEKKKRFNYGGGVKLTTRQAAFCWWMAKTWNLKESVIKAGYGAIRTRDQIKHANKLLTYKKIQVGIMSALRAHMAALNMEEKDLVIGRKDELAKKLSELSGILSDNLINKINSGKMIMPNELEMLKVVSEQLSTNLNDMAKWLGYEDDVNTNPAEEGFSFMAIAGAGKTPQSLREAGRQLAGVVNNSGDDPREMEEVANAPVFGQLIETHTAFDENEAKAEAEKNEEPAFIESNNVVVDEAEVVDDPSNVSLTPAQLLESMK